MSPTIAADDILLAEPRGSRLPRRGEIWVLPTHDEVPVLQAHRVTRVFRRGRALWIGTRGDANSEEDPPTRAEAAVGRVVAVGRAAGRRPSGTPSALAARWLLSGGAARLQAALTRFYGALSARPELPARLARRALIAANLAHEDILADVRAHALVAIASEASRRSGRSNPGCAIK
ncbi:MAG TPA: hypothetical protein VH309_00860 [Elusimicrobiota bacterium]|nr:hypothetical protein [Elusimicrobiota bacterium]